MTYPFLGLPLPRLGFSLNALTSARVNIHWRPILVPTKPSWASSLNRVTLIPNILAASFESIMSIPLLYRLIIKDKFVVDNGIFSAILGNVTSGIKQGCFKKTFALLVFNRIIRLSRSCGALASSLGTKLLITDVTILISTMWAAVPFLRAAPNQEAVMLQTPHKYNIIGTYGTVVTIYDEPRPRHARPNDITRGKNGAYYRFVASNGKLRLYDVTDAVKAMRRVLRGKTMEQVLSDVEREEKLSQYRRNRVLRRAVAGGV